MKDMHDIDEEHLYDFTEVWKFPLEFQDVATVSLPMGAQPLSVGEQGGSLVLWAGVLPENATKLREYRLRIAGTGHPLKLKELQCFLGTVQMSNGLVWHVWTM